MGPIFDHIKAEWQVLKGAPISFLVLLALGVLGGFGGGVIFMSQQLANVQSLVDLKDGQIDTYQKTINERLDRVEKQLSAQQLSSIQSVLRAYQSMVIVQQGLAPSPADKQLVKAFEESGWKVQDAQKAVEGQTVIRAPDKDAAIAIGEALNKGGVDFKATQMDAIQGTTDFTLGTWAD